MQSMLLMILELDQITIICNILFLDYSKFFISVIIRN